MVGLSVILETQKGDFGKLKSSTKVINKATVMIKTNTLLGKKNNNNSCFLDFCYLCKDRLLPGNDIYMYKGDKGFCSVECRCKQIYMDEEESIRKDNCSMAVINPKNHAASASASASASGSSSSSSSPEGSRNVRKTTRNRRGEFAY